MIKIYIENNIDAYDEYESEDETKDETKDEMSAEELINKIRKNRLNEIIDDINETEIKINNINILQSPDIAQVLMTRMIRSLKKYVKLHNLIKGPIKSKVNFVG